MDTPKKIDLYTKSFIYKIICSLNTGDYEKSMLTCVSDVLENGKRTVIVDSKESKYYYVDPSEDPNTHKNQFCADLNYFINQDHYKYKLDCGPIESITFEGTLFKIVIPEYSFFSRVWFKINQALYNISAERWTYEKE
ncbi:MAG: hypothetical protein ACRC5M_04945 [Anaeroplasmataceae bacterium]